MARWMELIYNIESFIDKVCMLAHKTGDEHEKRGLRASSLRCLSAMAWFMTEFPHVFADFEKIVHATLDNYEIDSQNEAEERNEARHNWVDEVARCEGRGATVVGDEFSPLFLNMAWLPLFFPICHPS